MAKDVIFLGAGASIPEKAPSQRELFEKYFALDLNNIYDRLHLVKIKKIFKKILNYR